MLFFSASMAYLLQIILFFALHVGSPYSPLVHAVSDFGVGRTKRLFMIYGLVGCAAAALLAFALLKDGRFPDRAWIYLALVAVLRLGVLAFPTDLEGQKLTGTGRLHYLFAIVSFALVFMAIDVLRPVAASPFPVFQGTPAVALSWIVTGSLVAVVVCLLPPLRFVFGLVERVFLLSTAIWLGWFAYVASTS